MADKKPGAGKRLRERYTPKGFEGTPELDALASPFEYGAEDNPFAAPSMEPEEDMFEAPWEEQLAQGPSNTGETLDLQDPVQYFPEGVKVEGKVPEMPGDEGVGEDGNYRGGFMDPIIGQYTDEMFKDMADMLGEEEEKDPVLVQAEELVQKPISKKEPAKGIVKKKVTVAKPKESVPMPDESDSGKQSKVKPNQTFLDSLTDPTRAMTPEKGAVDETDTVLSILMLVPGILKMLGGKAAMTAIKEMVKKIGPEEAAQLAKAKGPEAFLRAGPPPSPKGRVLKEFDLPSTPMFPKSPTPPKGPPPPPYDQIIKKARQDYGRAGGMRDSAGAKSAREILQRTLARKKAYEVGQGTASGSKFSSKELPSRSK